MKNTDPFAPWSDRRFKDDPQAPHNRDPDNPDKPWNKIFWKKTDLTKEEQYYYRLDIKFLNDGKSSERTRSDGP